MATNTEKLGLKKPSQNDFYNIDDFNENFQKIDDFANRKDNPHGVTPKQIGALPVIEANTDQFNMDTILKKGKHFEMYNTGSNTLGTPYKYGVTSLAACQILSYANGDEYGYQIAFMAGSIPFMRTFQKGIISEWTRGFLPLTGGTLTGDLKLNVGEKNFSLLEEIASSAKIEYRTYTGNETSGANNPNTLTFNRTPRVVFISADNDNSLGIFMYRCNLAIVYSDGAVDFGFPYCTWGDDGKTLTWWVEGSTISDLQLNMSIKYNVTAIS